MAKFGILAEMSVTFTEQTELAPLDNVINTIAVTPNYGDRMVTNENRVTIANNRTHRIAFSSKTKLNWY